MGQEIYAAHHSQDAAYRFPPGARPAGTPLWLGIRLASETEASGVVRVWRDGEGERIYELSPAPAGEGAIFLGATILLPPESGLVWYYFILTIEGETLYRSCEHPEHHHHIVCRSCGRTVEVSGGELEAWITRVSAKHGFTAMEHTAEFFGLCPRCSSKADEDV